jgi:hypothetical protein
MKTEDIQARDRVALTFTGEVAENDRNTPLEVKAGADGLAIDGNVFISWEWIDNARRVLQTLQNG